jgi:MraZ protein
MVGFLGEYEATLDTKGRFLLPIGLKRQMEEGAANRFVINRGLEKYLSLYSWQSWQKTINMITGLNEFDPEVRQFKRYFMNGATIMELDSAGRLLVPQNLKPHADLEKDIVLMGTGEIIEIWDKSKYDKFFENFPMETYSSMANKLLNKKVQGPDIP